MMTTNKIDHYLALLTIRHAAKRRDTIIAGGVFLVSFIAFIAFGMLERLSGRSLYLTTALVVTFGFAYLTTWVKLQIIHATIDAIENLN